MLARLAGLGSGVWGSEGLSTLLAKNAGLAVSDSRKGGLQVASFLSCERRREPALDPLPCPLFILWQGWVLRTPPLPKKNTHTHTHTAHKKKTKK